MAALCDGGALESKRILLIGSQPGGAQPIIDGLRRGGRAVEVDVVASGEHALDYLLRRGGFAQRVTSDPALILLDLSMPITDGHRFLERMKSDSRVRCLPVVVLIPAADEPEISAGYDLGANAYVVKPSEVREVVEVAEQIGRFWLGVNRAPR